MKPHRILKSFKGSQTGNDHQHFEAGATEHLSDDLAAIAVREGWAEPHHKEIKPRELAEGEILESGELPGDTDTGEKSAGAAPENKAFKKAPANKSRKAE
ncbi:hypothetical protein [Zavarzinella formosa]|uniref:hypothetical protein n=1 Tax=Zavarzinella formosa TaxID=360055 RepID=UPI0002DA494F|nr:hypothetical protein [Zavarzinella formosa]